MSNRVNLTITSDLSEGTLAEYFSNTGHEVSLAKMKHFFQGMMGGQFSASIATSINGGNGIAASKTITLTDCIVGDKLLISGVAFEAGVEWTIGADDSADASNLADAINASSDALISGIVTAESSGADVIITAVNESALGNLITLQAIGSDGISIPGEGEAATETLTCSSVADSDTAVINGVTLTAVDKKEKTQVTCIADTGALETVKVTVPNTASATQADYFVLSNTAGATAAFWLDIDAAGTAPTGAAYVAANSKIKVSIITGGTATQNATILKTAAATILGYAAVDNLDGTVTYTQTIMGNCTNAARHNADDSGNGSFSFSAAANGATSNLNNSYFTFFKSGNVTKYYMWYNVNGQGVDPAVASATGVQVTLSAGAVANTVASSSRAKFALSPLSTNFTESGATDKILFRNKTAGATTDTADGTAATGFTFSTQVDGGSVGATEFQIGDTDAASATALAALVNATSTLNTLVLAETSTADTVITAREDGVEGNNITLSATGGISAGGTRLSGGTDEKQARLTGGTDVSNEVSLNFGV